MSTSRTEGEASLTHMLMGGLLAAAATALCSVFLLKPLLGGDVAKTTSSFLLWFLLGYLAFAVAPPGQFPLRLLSARRLTTGLLVGLLGGAVILALDRLWPWP